MRITYLPAALVLLGACGNAERAEAIRLTKVLQQHQAVLSEYNSREPELFAGMKRWGGMVAFLGGGGDGGNPAQRARNYAGNIRSAKDQIATVRGALEQEQLEFAATQTARTNVVQVLQQREAYLERLVNILDRSAEEFPRMSLFNYPRSIGDLNQQLEAYEPPTDDVPQAINSLRLQYKITDDDLAN